MNGKIYGTVARVINFILFTPTVGSVKHSKKYFSLRFCHTQQTPNWSFSSHSLILIVWWWPPTCQSCGIALTVKHILVECANLRDIRQKYFTVSSVADLFKSIDNHTVINFIKETYFTTNYNLCYSNFILAPWPWFTLNFYHLLVIIWFYSYLLIL